MRDLEIALEKLKDHFERYIQYNHDGDELLYENFDSWFNELTHTEVFTYLFMVSEDCLT